jgi:hypothetical protein
MADCYRLVGDFEKAREHADKGMELSAVLSNDRYGRIVREGLTRVDSQIAERDSGPAMVFDFD